MSTVIAPENETIEKGRSKLELLRKTLAERQDEIATMQDDVHRLRGEEEQAVAEHVRRSPAKRAFAIGSPTERLRKRREKIEAELPLRQREAEALRQALDECEAEHADEDLAEDVKLLRVSQDRQRACWERAAGLLVDLADVWADVAVEINEADAEAARALASDAYRLASPEAKASLDAAARGVALVEPCPRSFPAFVGRIVEASQSSENMAPDLVTLEHGMGVVIDPKTGARVPAPPKIVQVPTSARFLDQRRVLRDVAPDLRAAPTIKPSQRFELLGGAPSIEAF